MDLDRIRRHQKELRKQRAEKKVVSVSDVSSHFIPDYATGTSTDTTKGTQKHREIEKRAEKISKDEMWRKIMDEGGFPEWFVRSICSFNQKIVLSGKIDMTYFRNGRPELVIERKYPREKNLDKTYQSEKVQAWTYSYMLDEAGFDTSNLDYTILKMPRTATHGEAKQVDEALIKFSNKGVLEDKIDSIADDAPFNIYGKKYSRDQHIEDLKDAINASKNSLDN